jgi:hypothetical protein
MLPESEVFVKACECSSFIRLSLITGFIGYEVHTVSLAIRLCNIGVFACNNRILKLVIGVPGEIQAWLGHRITQK